MISLGIPYAQIVEALGPPVEEKKDGVIQVLLYNSPSMTLADVYVVNDGTLESISLSHYNAPKEMSAFVQQFGAPDISVRKYAPGSPDSLVTVVHIWPSVGRSVTTTGTNQTNVIREDWFASGTEEKYFAGVGAALSTHERVTYAESQSQTTPAVPVKEGRVVIPLDVLAVFILIGLVFAWMQIRKRRQRQTQAS